MRKKKDRASPGKVFKNNLFAFRLIGSISPSYLFVKILQEVIKNVSILFEHTFLVAYIISCAESNAPFVNVLYMFVPVVGVIFARMFYEPWLDAVFYPLQKEKIQKGLRLKMYNKAVHMDIAYYDDPAFYNDFVWAMQDAPTHVFGSVDTMSYCISTICTLLITGIYIAAVDAWGILFVFATLLFSTLMQLRLNKHTLHKEEERKLHERKRDYINRVFYLAQYTKDLKMSHMEDKLYTDFTDAAKQLTRTENKYSPKITLYFFLDTAVKNVLAFDGAYLSYLLYQALALHTIGYGDLVALYNAAGRLRRNLSQFSSIFPMFQKHCLYLEKMRSFLEKENALSDEGKLLLPHAGVLSMENVSFRYPGATADTLHNIMLDIKPGEKIALVGYNGAGKSTLIKLLLRLYDPTGGCITYNGVPLPEYPLQELRAKFSAVFQNYELIAASLGENITMSRETLDEEKALEIFAGLGFTDTFAKLPDGFSTQVTKEFDEEGAGFSGGEAQKIAITRVLYANADILILDEPSSALDPLSEHKLNELILSLSEEKSVIIISHRLSTTRMVDKIYMLEGGRIIESGAHDALIALNGKYAQMFHLQAEKYRTADKKS